MSAVLYSRPSRIFYQPRVHSFELLKDEFTQT